MRSHGKKDANHDAKGTMSANSVMEFRKHLRSLGACSEASDWASLLNARQAWTKCTRPDWRRGMEPASKRRKDTFGDDVMATFPSKGKR